MASLCIYSCFIYSMLLCPPALCSTSPDEFTHKEARNYAIFGLTKPSQHKSDSVAAPRRLTLSGWTLLSYRWDWWCVILHLTCTEINFDTSTDPPSLFIYILWSNLMSLWYADPSVHYSDHVCNATSQDTLTGGRLIFFTKTSTWLS